MKRHQPELADHRRHSPSCPALWLVHRGRSDADGQTGEIFAGARQQGAEPIGEIARPYQRWFENR